MTDRFDLIIKGGTCVSHAGIGPADIAVSGGRIAAIGTLDETGAERVLNAEGLHVLPGVIDTQVHFREPGNEHKEDLASGSRSAVLGGVTAVFEMPNTSPSTTTPEALEDKIKRARGRMWCDHAFYVGATAANAEMLGLLERTPGCCGVKVFMGSSTGNLLVAEDEDLRRVLLNGTRRVAIHSEDESRLIEREPLRREGGVKQHPVWRDAETAMRSTRRIVRLARETGRRLHILHVTTADEMQFLGNCKDIVSVETTPQHLTLTAPDCYARLGTLAQMNPPIRDSRHQTGLWEAISNGVVDVIGSDHAPHTREEKSADYPHTPSGMPGVQTLLPLLLNHVAEGRLTLERLVDLTSHGANRIFGLREKGRLAVGFHADLTIVDLKKQWTISDDWSQSKCGWTPFAGMRITGKPAGTIIRGHQVMWEDELLGSELGQPIRFQETIEPKGD